MKKIVVMLLLCVSLCGCGSSASKVDDALMNHFSSDYRELLKEANPDVVSMEYLVKHASDYACDITSERNDFFVVLCGCVSNVEAVEYDEDILSGMDEDVAALLRESNSLDVYLDDSAESISVDAELYDIEVGREYYFFVHVRESVSGYSFSAFDVFDFN